MARDTRITIKVTADTKKEMIEVSERYGLTISCLGAFVLGKWLSEEKEGARSVVTAGHYGQGAPE